MKPHEPIRILLVMVAAALVGLPLIAFFNQPANAFAGADQFILPGYEQESVFILEPDAAKDNRMVTEQIANSSESELRTGSSIAAAGNNPGNGFVHISTEGGTPIITIMDAPALNNNPDQIFIASLVKNPGGIPTPYHNHPIGAYYWASTGQWGIFNEDSASMPFGQVFNIFVPAASSTAFTHISTVDNVSVDATRIDNPALDGDINAFVFALPVNNPGGSTVGIGTYNHPIGVFYRNGHWWLFNEDYQNFTADAAFFVYKADPAVDIVFQHLTTSQNVDGYKTYLDHPELNGNPNALVFIQHRKTDSSLDDTVGVWYDPSANRWTIYQTSEGAMKSNQIFNVLVIPNKEEMFVYTATEDRIVPGEPHSLRIDHPLLNGNPNAQIQVINHVTPAGYLDSSTLAVNYYSNSWHIYHADYSSIPLGASYNVYVNYPQINAYSTQASSSNTISSTLTLSHPYLNSQTDAIFLQTQNISPAEGVHGILYNYSTAADYGEGLWSISRVSGPAYPSSAAFNVLIPDRNRFIHIANSENILEGFATCIDNPLTNNRKSAILFVTANNKPNGIAAPIEDSNLSVYYYPNWNQWCIFTQDFSTISQNTAFNVFTDDLKVFLPLIKR